MHRQDIVNKFHADLDTWLDGALRQAVKSYTYFSLGAIPEDAKGFSVYQNACRAALAHVHLLLRVAMMVVEANTHDTEENEEQELQRMIAHARDALMGFAEEAP